MQIVAVLWLVEVNQCVSVEAETCLAHLWCCRSMETGQCGTVSSIYFFWISKESYDLIRRVIMQKLKQSAQPHPTPHNCAHTTQL